MSGDFCDIQTKTRQNPHKHPWVSKPASGDLELRRETKITRSVFQNCPVHLFLVCDLREALNIIFTFQCSHPTWPSAPADKWPNLFRLKTKWRFSASFRESIFPTSLWQAYGQFLHSHSIKPNLWSSTFMQSYDILGPCLLERARVPESEQLGFPSI